MKKRDKCNNIPLRTILNVSNLILNNYHKINWLDNNLLKINLQYFDYGYGTKILPFLKHKSFYFNYWVDFKNKKLIDKNFLGKIFNLNNEELDLIYNKYYWAKK